MGVGAQWLHVPATTRESVPQMAALPPSLQDLVPPVGIETTAAEPIETHVGAPVRVRIDTIGVDAKVEEMGVLPDGKLDAPARGEDAGWYKFGPRPGEGGAAVIDGHLDLHGRQGVFWHLRHVQIGDEIRVTDDLGTERLFRVTRTKTYHVNEAPLQEIFGMPEGKHLHLITCAGVWRREMDHYDHRLVVYAEMVE